MKSKHDRSKPQYTSGTVALCCFACKKVWAQPTYYSNTDCPYCGQAETKTKLVYTGGSNIE